MSFTPITGTPSQYLTENNELASGYYLKLYLSGTTTPYSMATDSTGATLLAKCKLSTEGYPITNALDETTVFIPHVDADYRIVLYRNETDADNNTTGNAAFNVDGLSPDVAQLATTAEITTKGTTLQSQDDYDRSPLFVDVADFTAGAGPHVITVPIGWTPSNADMRFYRLDASGIITALTPTVTTATTFTLAETLLTTDTIFIGDDEFRNQFDGDPENIRDRLSVTSDEEIEIMYLPSESVKIGTDFNYTSEITNLRACSVSEDGSDMVLCDDSDIYLYTISDQLDLAASVFSGESLDVSANVNFISAFFRSADGIRFFIAEEDIVHYYLLTDRLDFSTAIYGGAFDFSGDGIVAMFGISFSNDGKSFFAYDMGFSIMHSYTLATEWSLSTRNKNTGTLTINNGESRGLFISSGNDQVVIDSRTGGIFRYSIPNPPLLDDAVQVGISGGGSISNSSSFAMSSNGYSLRCNSTNSRIEAWGVPAVLKKKFYV